MQEAAILADRVAADRRLARRHPLHKEVQGAALCFGQSHIRSHHAIPQAAGVMSATVPVVHGFEPFERMMDGQLRAFGQHLKMGIGHESGDFDDAVAVRIKPGHLQIDPDQVIVTANGRHDDAWLESRS